MILAIDTATRSAGLAILDPEREVVLAEHAWRSHINHTVELTPNLYNMLATQKLTTADLTGIVVVRGPGSFTGLRIGMSVGKALAYALEIDIVAIPTPDIIAHAHQPRDLTLWAVLEAGRGRVVAVRYPVEGPTPSEADYRITTLAKLVEEIDEPVLFSGELDSAGVRQLTRSLGQSTAIASPADRMRRPAHLAEAGWLRLKDGHADDPATLAPIYLHLPDE